MPVPWCAHKGQEWGEPNCCPDGWGPALPVSGKSELRCLVSQRWRPQIALLSCSRQADPTGNYADTYTLFLFSLQWWGNRAVLVVLCCVQRIPKALSFTLYMLQVPTPVLQGPNLLLSWVMPQIQSRFIWVLQSMSNEGFYGEMWTEHSLSQLKCLALFICFLLTFPHPPCWKSGSRVLAVFGSAIILLVTESLKENILCVRPCKCLCPKPSSILECHRSAQCVVKQSSA